jgi:hypothetical protein
MTETDEQFRRKLARLANATSELMDGTTGPIRGRTYRHGGYHFSIFQRWFAGLGSHAEFYRPINASDASPVFHPSNFSSGFARAQVMSRPTT